MNNKFYKRPIYGLQIKRLRRILGNEETEKLIDDYMEDKKNEYVSRFDTKRCPSCGLDYEGYPALSRLDNKTDIWPDCGTRVALADFVNYIEKKEKGGK